MYVYMYIHIYIYMYIYIHVHIHVLQRRVVEARDGQRQGGHHGVGGRGLVEVCDVYNYITIPVYVYVCICMCIYIYIYVYAHIHLYMSATFLVSPSDACEVAFLGGVHKFHLCEEASQSFVLRALRFGLCFSGLPERRGRLCICLFMNIHTFVYI